MFHFCYASERNETLIKTGYLSSFQVILNNRKAERISNGNENRVHNAVTDLRGSKLIIESVSFIHIP